MEFGFELQVRVKKGMVGGRWRQDRLRVQTGGERWLHDEDVEAVLPDAVQQLLVREVHARPLPLVGVAAALKVEPERSRDMQDEKNRY